MTKKEKQLRLSELNDYIAEQEMNLLFGSKRLRELNDQYNILDQEYKVLVSKKKVLVDDIIVLTQNLDIYSKF